MTGTSWRSGTCQQTSECTLNVAGFRNSNGPGRGLTDLTGAMVHWLSTASRRLTRARSPHSDIGTVGMEERRRRVPMKLLKLSSACAPCQFPTGMKHRFGSSSFMCDEATLAWKLNTCERTGCTVGMESHNSLSKVTRSFDHGGLQLVRSEHPSFSLPQQTCFFGFGAWDARASFYQLLLKRFQVLRDPQHCLQGVCQHRSESIAQWSAASSWHLSCGSSPSRVPCTLGSMDIACLRALIVVHPACIEPTA